MAVETVSEAGFDEEELKYKHKCKQLRQKILKISAENDLLVVKLARMKRSIQRLRLERAFIFEKLEERVPSTVEDSGTSDSSVSFKREKDSPHSETHEILLTHSSGTGGARRRRTRDPDAPKRPSNPFLKFCDVERERIRSENEGIDGFDVTRALGVAWQNLDDDSRKPYYDAYESEKKLFKIKMDQYESENPRSGQNQKFKSTDDSNVRQKCFKNSEKLDTKNIENENLDINDETCLDIND
ncbi:hypothetical protein T552_01656 [Pneumocystis carinii B80]|uniref:HMG box domain-containing protein n=1 Tax=Pneumocystis carinii (strain B80) TaxID=1408658 RepID=A0A0W4ZJ62_PNEC8|nr:hypothetical protein T552_01656 [Pneumocystis carinii B80]KTW28394.1 hypothetical protein T552_01656 [Pneumocystis carinii B80]